MKLLSSLLALLLASAGAQAATTQIAQLPLLNVTGTGMVKPNLMLLYDNSGSMASNFTPDFIDDSTSCRDGSLMTDGTQKCLIGHPPFASSDYNKQYYNPKIQYETPVKADGTRYPSMTSANTTAWTSVTTDAFGKNNRNMSNSSASASNLVTGYPDLKWCNGGSPNVCVYNSATYSYPTNTYSNASSFNTNAYFYTINVAEWCSDANLTVCSTTNVGDPAPLGKPFPAKLRYCSDTALSTCQAKYNGAFIYPRFGNPNGGQIASYGTITVGVTAGSTSQNITSVSVTEAAGSVVITGGSVNAPTGTTNSTKQATLANALALSIINKTGLTNQYSACVRTPTLTGVLKCSDLGITLGADNIVAVVPLDCSPAATSKAIGQCSVLVDASRSGWAITAVNGTIPLTTVPLSAGNAVFVRTDIVSGRNYPRDDHRLDCVAATFCTYAEEMTNFANWYAYYKTRNQMMKTSVGRAFGPVTASFKVGVVSLSVAAAEGTITPPAAFSGTTRSDFYDYLYAMDGSNSTPLRQALNSVGKMYANQGVYATAAGSEVVKYPCEQNFVFMTTDGYWNGGAPTGVNSNDQVESTNRYCLLASGCVDPRSQTAPSLADVALYWYNGGFNTYTAGANSLRPTLEDWTKPGLVTGGTGDNRRLHMTTYTLGLGVDGIMTYDPKYDKSPVVGSDFYKLITRASSGCPWNSNGAYVWPDPAAGDSSGSAAYQTRVDDLWHAAVNGHGKYFSAADPNAVINGLQDALANIESSVGAAAAAATSTPNISQQDNDIFSDTFTTVKWYGELSDKKINTITGDVLPTPVWLSSDRLGRQVGTSTDTRVLKMLDTTNGTLKNFTYAAMSATEKAWFDTKCSSLPQCLTLSPADKVTLDTGANIINWLRGQQQYADDNIMRAYSMTDHNPPGLTSPIPIVLGDIASSKPAFLRDPRKQYTMTGYNDYVVANQNRQATVFAAANDGMLHAFNATTGDEMWAYVPRITMKKLYLLSSIRYGTNHQYTTDGSPELADIQIGGVWKTILVGGLNGGGRGYYALDVTDPTNPKALWELCADSTVCSGGNFEPELGLSFGNPQFGMFNGQWTLFLTSGYNNVSGSDGVMAGTGQAYLFLVDPATGVVRQKIAVGAADAVTPIGFTKISAITNDPTHDPVVTYIYGGDNQGQMWRFDLTSATIVKNKMGNTGSTQPITTRPDITTCKVSTVVSGVTTVSTKKVVVFGTGRLLDLPDVADVAVQSIYGLKDTTTEITPLRTSLQEQVLSEIVDGSSVNYYRITANNVDLSVKAGWYLDLKLNAGERVNLDPKVVSGTLVAVTNIPSSSSACSVGGSSNVYELDVCSGSFVSNSSSEKIGTDIVAGKTLSATSAAVGFIMIRLPSGIIKMVTTTADGHTITGNGPRGTDKGTTRSGWRQVKE